MDFEDYAFNTVEDEEKKKSKIKPTYLIGAAVLLLIAIVYVGMNFLPSSASNGFQVESNETKTETASENSSIFVHVAGEVKSPGMVEIASGERVATAIEKAGGATENAVLDSINLAKKCEDGEQIVVPSKVSSESSASGGSDTSSSTGGSSTSTNNGKVNINTADATGLQQISGIGPSKAQKIIAYREQNGKFKSIEDLTNVSGIGEKTLASIRDQICV